MEQSALLAHGQREISELHRFFQDWYRGVPARGFERFEQALDPDFVIILPDARVLSRDQIVQAVRAQRGSDPEAVLEIRNVALRSAQSTVSIFSYEEWQGRGGGPLQGRLSSVVFVRDARAPNGLRWLHVHETALELDP